MHVIHRTRGHCLLSMTAHELAVVEAALAAAGTVEAAQCCAALREAVSRVGVAEDWDVMNAWEDGGAVLVRAISVHGDPLDMSSEEARRFAAQIVKAADAADG